MFVLHASYIPYEPEISAWQRSDSPHNIYGSAEIRYNIWGYESSSSSALFSNQAQRDSSPRNQTYNNMQTVPRDLELRPQIVEAPSLRNLAEGVSHDLTKSDTQNVVQNLVQPLVQNMEQSNQQPLSQNLILNVPTPIPTSNQAPTQLPFASTYGALGFDQKSLVFLVKFWNVVNLFALIVQKIANIVVPAITFVEVNTNTTGASATAKRMTIILAVVNIVCNQIQSSSLVAKDQNTKDLSLRGRNRNRI